MRVTEHIGNVLKLVLSLALVLPLLQPAPASAFQIGSEWNVPPGTRIQYTLGSDFTNRFGNQGRDAAHIGDSAWWTQYQYDRVHFWDAGNVSVSNYIGYRSFAGTPQSSLAAYVKFPGWDSDTNFVGCRSTTAACEMWINSATGWDADNNYDINSDRLDLASVMVHEFGHWHGIQHPLAGQRPPSTDPATSVMNASIGGGVIRRQIRQDDSNGFYAARLDRNWNGVLSNPSFEPGGSLSWRSYAGSFRQICGSAFPLHGQCFAKLVGPNASSIYQDVELTGKAWPNGRPVRMIVRARAAQTTQLDIRLWSLNWSGRNVGTTCTIPGNSQWTTCNVGPFVPYGNDTRLRFETYKLTTGEVDFDVPALGPAN